jgi:hypothetical protein
LQGTEIEEDLGASLDGTIGQEARFQAGEAEELRKKLENGLPEGTTLHNAWESYGKLVKSSQPIFREALELIGGLAIRNKELDTGVYGLADELVRYCAEASIGDRRASITIPAHQETVDKTLARIIRLRFPEWTIWTLAFTAHEFGHIVTRDNERLQQFVLAQPSDWGRYLLQEILADTFATYTMGPAYACAAVLLRFNPPIVSDVTPGYLGDAKRAHAVFTMLHKMGKEAAGKVDANPYEKIEQCLEQQWQAVLNQSEPNNWIEPKDKERLGDLVDAIWRQFSRTLRPTARYSHEANSWALAKAWGQHWLDELEADQQLTIPKVSSTHKVRDALNAAWVCRVYSGPEKADYIAKAAYKLCNEIMTCRDRASTNALNVGT